MCPPKPKIVVPPAVTPVAPPPPPQPQASQQADTQVFRRRRPSVPQGVYTSTVGVNPASLNLGGRNILGA